MPQVDLIASFRPIRNSVVLAAGYPRPSEGQNVSDSVVGYTPWATVDGRTSLDHVLVEKVQRDALIPVSMLTLRRALHLARRSRWKQFLVHGALVKERPGLQAKTAPVAYRPNEREGRKAGEAPKAVRPIEFYALPVVSSVRLERMRERSARPMSFGRHSDRNLDREGRSVDLYVLSAKDLEKTGKIDSRYSKAVKNPSKAAHLRTERSTFDEKLWKPGQHDWLIDVLAVKDWPRAAMVEYRFPRIEFRIRDGIVDWWVFSLAVRPDLREGQPVQPLTRADRIILRGERWTAYSFELTSRLNERPGGAVQALPEAMRLNTRAATVPLHMLKAAREYVFPAIAAFRSVLNDRDITRETALLGVPVTGPRVNLRDGLLVARLDWMAEYERPAIVVNWAPFGSREYVRDALALAGASMRIEKAPKDAALFEDRRARRLEHKEALFHGDMLAGITQLEGLILSDFRIPKAPMDALVLWDVRLPKAPKGTVVLKDARLSKAPKDTALLKDTRLSKAPKDTVLLKDVRLPLAPTDASLLWEVRLPKAPKESVLSEDERLSYGQAKPYHPWPQENTRPYEPPMEPWPDTEPIEDPKNPPPNPIADPVTGEPKFPIVGGYDPVTGDPMILPPRDPIYIPPYPPWWEWWSDRVVYVEEGVLREFITRFWDIWVTYGVYYSHVTASEAVNHLFGELVRWLEDNAFDARYWAIYWTIRDCGRSAIMYYCPTYLRTEWGQERREEIDYGTDDFNDGGFADPSRWTVNGWSFRDQREGDIALVPNGNGVTVTLRTNLPDGGRIEFEYSVVYGSNMRLIALPSGEVLWSSSGITDDPYGYPGPTVSVEVPPGTTALRWEFEGGESGVDRQETIDYGPDSFNNSAFADPSRWSVSGWTFQEQRNGDVALAPTYSGASATLSADLSDGGRVEFEYGVANGNTLQLIALPSNQVIWSSGGTAADPYGDDESASPTATVEIPPGTTGLRWRFTGSAVPPSGLRAFIDVITLYRYQNISQGPESGLYGLIDVVTLYRYYYVPVLLRAWPETICQENSGNQAVQKVWECLIKQWKERHELKSLRRRWLVT